MHRNEPFICTFETWWVPKCIIADVDGLISLSGPEAEARAEAAEAAAQARWEQVTGPGETGY